MIKFIISVLAGIGTYVLCRAFWEGSVKVWFTIGTQHLSGAFCLSILVFGLVLFNKWD